MSYKPILFCTYRPGPPLDRFVERLWYWEGVPLAHAKDRLLPGGSCGLIINLFEDENRLYSGPNDDVSERSAANHANGPPPREALRRGLAVALATAEATRRSRERECV